MDREKVISNIREAIEYTKFWKKYYASVDINVLSDAYELLKEQDAVEPKISESYRTNSGRMSRRKAWCGACGIGINMGAKFCDHCGRAVKWE